MTILVSGAGGFIGSSFCHWLLQNTDHIVVGLDNMSGGHSQNLEFHKNFRFVPMDISSDSLNKIFEIYKPEVVYHMAAYASEGRANHIRAFIHQNNTVGTANVINACINYGAKLIFTSSVAVYSGEPPYSEETIPNPIDEYGLSKWTSERSIQIAGEQSDLKWVIVRPRNVYGPRQSIFDPSRNLFGIWCYNAINNLPLTIFGNGEHRRCFTYVDDIMLPLFHSMDYDKEIFNLGAEKSYSINEAAAIFSDVSWYKNIYYGEERHEVPEAICDIEKSERFLAYKTKTDLHDGVEKMWQWAKSIPMRERLVPPPLEIKINAHASLL